MKRLFVLDGKITSQGHSGTGRYHHRSWRPGAANDHGGVSQRIRGHPDSSYQVHVSHVV